MNFLRGLHASRWMANRLGFRVNSPTVSKTFFSNCTFPYHLEMPLRLWLSAWPHVAVVANVDLGSQLIAGCWAGVSLYLGWSAPVLTSGNLENPFFYFGRLDAMVEPGSVSMQIQRQIR